MTKPGEAGSAAVHAPASVRFKGTWVLALRLDLSSGPATLRIADAAVRLRADGETHKIDVEIERTVAPDVLEGLRALGENRVPKGTQRSHPSIEEARAWGRDPFTADGGLTSPGALPFDALPPDLITFCRDVHAELSAIAMSVARAIRWRLDVRGQHRPLSGSSGPWWSEDGEAWVPLPGQISARVWTQSVPKIENPWKAEIERLASVGPPEPVAHELLREAEDNRGSNPRSSLLLCVAAIEIGTKAYIGCVAPDAEWLAFESPAPPIPRIMASYLPTLDTKRGTPMPAPPKAARTKIQTAIEARNRLAHAGNPEFPVADLDELIDITRTLLYAFDWFCGHDWALAHIHRDDQAAWGLVASSGAIAPSTAAPTTSSGSEAAEESIRD